MFGYYERLLVAMAGSILLGVAASFHPVVELYQGAGTGALVATVFLYEALFRNPPLPPTDPRVAAGTAVWHGCLAIVVLVALL
ncbi:hypothetical protein [Natrialbaceae archaeon AArc-T1-2]|uniref:hypothetical protein n=1 Tax=Natrialbaceae archaeon AArc-T1-2 TaxID=3053904 RepID=UPI00255AB085|nr:hypothetical protein [Natrialbaceae archaeon AArc-T1-2]WIV67645.1 hypothetical protein QQ977_02625 [Natrialbaceae archaeon AArc-T1-2]